MKAIFLCAGFGTRMYPLTKTNPKPLLKVSGRPVLDYLMDQVARFPGLKSIHLVSNDRFYKDFIEWEANRVQKPKTGRPQIFIYNNGITENRNRRGAIADLGFVLKKAGSDNGAFVAAGDNIPRFSLLPIWEKFLYEKRNYIIALPEEDKSRLNKTGVIELDENNLVRKLHEKPARPPSNWFCPPFYYLKQSALERVHHFLLTANEQDAPGHFIAYLVGQEEVFAMKVNSNRFDTGSMISYTEANQVLAQEPVIKDPGLKDSHCTGKLNETRKLS